MMPTVTRPRAKLGGSRPSQGTYSSGHPESVCRASPIRKQGAKGSDRKNDRRQEREYTRCGIVEDEVGFEKLRLLCMSDHEGRST